MLSKVISFLLLFFSLNFSQINVLAQQLDSVASKMAKYGKERKTSSVFVHFDKNIYSNNDQVWFTGYLLSAITNTSNYHTLYVSLVHDADSAILFHEKFLIEKGMSFGNFVLPDSLPTGSYHFVVNTNIKKGEKHEGTFIQPISIKSTTTNSLIGNLSILKAYDNETNNGTVLLKLLTSENRFVQGADIRYSIGRNKVLRSGFARSNVIGELKIDFSKEEINNDNNLLRISAKKGNEIRYFNFELPVASASSLYQCKFYPEGGYLISGLKEKVGFEIKDSNHKGVMAKAILYVENEILDTISTNSYGMGTFYIKPELSKKYRVKLLNDAIYSEYFELPPVVSNGVALTADDAISDDHFRIKLQANQDRKVHLLVHNYTEIYLSTSLSLEKFSVQNVRFNLDSLPVGLATVTVLDEEYRPLAERIFFAKYHELNRVNLSTDKLEYGTRDSVKLKIDILPQRSFPNEGFVSISCVQANRYSLINQRNIVDYTFIERALESSPIHLTGYKTGDRSYLNQILLIKGWSRFKWPDIFNNKIDEEVFSAELKGRVFKGSKPISTPMKLNLIAKDNINAISSDSSGNFSVNAVDLVTSGETDFWLSLQAKNASLFKIVMDDPSVRLKEEVRREGFRTTAGLGEVLFDLVKPDPRSIILKEVIIKGAKTEDIAFAKNGYMNRCGDYVCLNKILNCPNHFGDSRNTNPVQHERYKHSEGGSVTYHGCIERKADANISILKAIKLPREFYRPDIQNLDEPITMSTIFWDYHTLLNTTGPTYVNFTTGDLTGTFKIIVQGVTTSGPIFGEAVIRVKQP